MDPPLRSGVARRHPSVGHQHLRKMGQKRRQARRFLLRRPAIGTMKTNPTTVRLRLTGHHFIYPFVADHCPEYISFGREEYARRFPRSEAASVLRRIRVGGNYYRMEVL